MNTYQPDLVEQAQEAREDALAARPPGPAPRPKDAATLILVRRTPDGPRILMGQRGRGHSFMPDKYVFPGGKVDPTDGAVPAASEPASDTLTALAHGGVRRRARAFALAAVREMWEEAGLLVARTATAGSPAYRGPDPGWQSLFAAGAAPHLEPLRYIGRAITPPSRHKRFDARFFMADADEALLDARPAQDGAEMGDLRWFAFDEALGLDLPSVTRFMLGELKVRLEQPDHEPGIPFLRWTRSGHRMDRL